jgi:GntR family transcriptional regulator, transcriptional repressor for pyruvate dehydrogenase complex
VLNAQWHEAANFPRQRRTALAQDIADHLRRRIVTGDLHVGQRLPGIHRLATLFGVSSPTAQSAIHILRALGFVRVSHGNGTYVARPRGGAATLTYAFLKASTTELAEMRAAIDRRVPAVVARAVASGQRSRLPRTLSDISFLAGERAMARHMGPESYLRADLAFHEAIIRSVRGLEATREVYASIGERLGPALLGAADLIAADEGLDGAHRQLAAVILGGSTLSAERLARDIAERELRPLAARPLG